MPTWCLCSCSSRLLSNSALRARVSVALLSSSSARCLQTSESGNNGPLKEGLGRPGVAVRTARRGTWLPAGPVAPSLRPPHCRAAAAAAPGPDAPAPGAAQTCRTVRMLTPTVGGHGTQLQPHTRLWMASAGGSPCPHTGLALLSSTLRGEPGTNRSKPLPWLVPLSFLRVGEHDQPAVLVRVSGSRGRSQPGGTDSGGGVINCSLVPRPPSPSSDIMAWSHLRG